MRGASVVVVGILSLSAAPAGRQAPEPLDPIGAIVRAVTTRIGDEAIVDVRVLDVLPATGARYREAEPDPSARLGRPIRFRLVDDEGRRLSVSAAVTVTGPYVIARRAVLRGHRIDASAVAAMVGPVSGVPLARLPQLSEVVGAQALRPIAAGELVTPASVALRRAVEPGEPVIVVALAGSVEVTATFVAADGGHIGDTIRVRNPESRTFIRGRIVERGRVEVTHDR